MHKPPQTTGDIHCTVCDSNTRVQGYGQQYGTLQAIWGYGSQHDGERYLVHLCEACFFGVLAYLRQERCIHTLYDDEQAADDQLLGQAVAGAECNTVIELRQEHHIAYPRLSASLRP